MTNLEIKLSIILYIIVGLWLCYKRDWYDTNTGEEQFFICGIAIILMPINLLIILVKEFILSDWDN